MTAAIFTPVGIASEQQLEVYPKFWRRDGTKRGIILAHGANGNALECRTPTGANLNWYQFVDAAVEAGFAVLSLDFGGNAWGNATAMSRMNDAFTYMTTVMGAKTDAVGFIAQSMGHLTVMNWVANNRAKAAFVVSSMGVADLNNIYGNATYTASINAAYGGTYNNATMGAASNPTVNTSTKYAGLPWLGFAGTADTTCPIELTRTLRQNIGSSATLLEATDGAHNWATTGQWSIPAMLSFIDGYR